MDSGIKASANGGVRVFGLDSYISVKRRNDITRVQVTATVQIGPQHDARDVAAALRREADHLEAMADSYHSPMPDPASAYSSYGL